MACNLQIEHVVLSNGLPRYELTIFERGRVRGIFVATTTETLAERCATVLRVLNVEMLVVYIGHACWHLATSPLFPASRFRFLTYSNLPQPMSSCHVDVDYVWGETDNSEEVRELRASTVCNFPDISIVTGRLYETTLRGLYRSAASFATLLRSSNAERVVLDGDLVLVASIELDDNDTNSAARLFVRHPRVRTNAVAEHVASRRDLDEYVAQHIAQQHRSDELPGDYSMVELAEAANSAVGVDWGNVSEVAGHDEQPVEGGESATAASVTSGDAQDAEISALAAMSAPELGQPYLPSWDSSPLIAQWEAWRQRRTQEIMEQTWTRYADHYSLASMQWSPPVTHVPEELPEKLPKTTRKRRHALLSPTKLEDE